MLTVVPMRYGTAFKKAFSHPDAFSALVKGALDIDFRPKRIEQEYSFRPAVAHVNIAYDLFAEDVQQRTIVELQHVRDDESYDRFLCIRSRYGIVTPGKRDKKSPPPNISLDRQVLFSPSATGEAVFGGVPLGPRPQFSC